MKYKTKNTTKKDILPVFIKQMADRGYQGANLKRVAEDLFITPPALFKHYKNKAAVHAACCKALDDIDPIITAKFIVQSVLYSLDECDTIKNLKDAGLHDEVGDSFKVLADNYE